MAEPGTEIVPVPTDPITGLPARDKIINELVRWFASEYGLKITKALLQKLDTSKLVDVWRKRQEHHAQPTTFADQNGVVWFVFERDADDWIAEVVTGQRAPYQEAFAGPSKDVAIGRAKEFAREWSEGHGGEAEHPSSRDGGGAGALVLLALLALGGNRKR